MSPEELGFLQRGNYISFATRRKSGEFVATPVWFAKHGGGYYVFSAGAAGKVKRLRNFAESRIAACTARGTVTGPWLDTRAYVLDEPADCALALRALRRKYGWQMAIGDVFAHFSGRMQRRAYIRIEPAAN
ncbi:MAG: PPOX class F420-dependent oxidoreductase [Halioglobus sp.]|nr:PPOX class F420-dependent oxidoreductase [Halioglobus sp.]